MAVLKFHLKQLNHLKVEKIGMYLYKALLCIDQIGRLHFLVILVSAYMYMWGGCGV